MSEDFTVSILANDINRDCRGQYHFRNKISKSDQKEKDEPHSRLAPKFHPATTRPRLGVVPSLRGETYRTWPIAEIFCRFELTCTGLLKLRASYLLCRAVTKISSCPVYEISRRSRKHKAARGVWGHALPENFEM